MMKKAMMIAGAVGMAAVGLGVPVTYRLPKSAGGERTYLVSLAIVDAKNPDWIISTFVAGQPRTVSPGQNTFTEEWDGLDENFMPVPPGTYGVKGIYAPAEKWDVDGQYHAVTASWHSGVGSFLPAKDTSELWKIPMAFHGDPVNSPMRDVDVTPEGIGVFYYQYLENGKNAPVFDLTRPLGPGQFLRAHNSGGAGGGPCAATDGETVWACSTDGAPWFVYRPDAKPFGADHARHRRNVYLPKGVVPAMAAWRDAASGKSFVYVLEAEKIVVEKTPKGHEHYTGSATERVDCITVLAGEDGKVLGSVPVPHPLGIVARGGRLYVLTADGGRWTVGRFALEGGMPVGGMERVFEAGGGQTPGDLEVDADGRFYVSFPNENTVRQYDAAGKELRRYGKLAAQPPGGYDAETMMSPVKLGVWKGADGVTRLIAVETDGPNRASEWNADTGAFIREYTTYQTKANNGYAQDPADPSLVYLPGHGGWMVRWKIDYAKGAWAVDAVWPDVTAGQRSGLDKPVAVRVGGRLYLASEQNLTVYRMSDDGKRLLRSAGVIRRGEGQGQQAYFWNDANGNGAVDDDELRPCQLPPGAITYHGQKWLDGLTYVTAAMGGKDVLSLSPSGFDAHGNPVFTEWKKVLTDPVFEAIERGNPGFLLGGNELASTYSSDWAQANRGPAGDLYVQARGGKSFNANEGAQFKLSRYVKDAKGGGYRLRWRVGRSQSIGGRGPGHLSGAMRVFPAYNGIVSVIDQSRSGVVLYTDEGLYVDTLFPPGDTREELGVYRQPGEFFAGTVYPNPKTGKLYYAAGKYTPFLYEINAWTLKDNPVRKLDGLPKAVTLLAKDTAAPPEVALVVRGGSGRARLATFTPAAGGAAWDGSMAGWENASPVTYASGADRAVEVRCLYTPDMLLLRYAVRLGGTFNARPMPPPERIFTHDQQADTLGFYFQGDPGAQPPRTPAGRPGDARLVFGIFQRDGAPAPVAVGLYPSWDKPGAKPQAYRTPVGAVSFAHVGEAPGVRLGHALDADGKGFVLVAGIPRAALPGQDRPFAGGFTTMVNFDANLGGHDRFWWANSDGSASTETYDEPSEARLCPGSWAPARFEGLGQGLAARHWMTLGPFGGPGAEAFSWNPGQDVKPKVEAMYEKAGYPPDSGAVNLSDTFTGPLTEGWWPKPGTVTWKAARTDDLDARVTLGSAGQCWYAATWVHAPGAVTVEAEFLSHPQTYLRWRLNNEAIAIKPGDYGNTPIHTHARSAKRTVTLNAGWNLIHVRGYCVGYSPFKAGLILHADEATLWQLKLAAPPTSE